MSIVPTDVPMTAALCRQCLSEITREYPFTRLEQLATTAFGRALQSIRIGSGPRKVIYSAAFHANEWITATLLLKFAEEYCRAINTGASLAGIDAGTLAQQTTIHIVPMVNPDGVDLVTGVLQPGSAQYERAFEYARSYPGIPFPDGWKANLLGVDLNLQFPAGWLRAREIKFSQGYTSPGPRDYVGRFPLSQIESQAMYDLTQRVDPDLVLSYHAQGQVIYYQYADILIPGAQELAQRFSQLSGYTLEQVPYASGFAGYKDWFIQAFRRPGFTVEVGQGTNPLPLSQFDKIYRDNLGILMTAAAG